MSISIEKCRVLLFPVTENNIMFQVCDGEIDLVAKVERCRQAILEGLRVEFAHQPAPPLPGVGTHKVGPPPPPPHYPGFSHYSGRGRGRGTPGRTSSHPGK